MLVYEKKGHRCAICSEEQNYKAFMYTVLQKYRHIMPFTSILSDLHALNFEICSKMENGKLVHLSPPILIFFQFFFKKCFFLLPLHANQSKSIG